ncbi:MAG: Fic family protein [Marmoricola sp.]
MKTPAPPPDFNRLMEQLSASDRFSAVLSQALPVGALTQGYLPWDKLRYKTPPGDLTHEEWWFVVKLARRSVQRSIPAMQDIEGRPFTYALPDEVLAAVDAINRSASGNITVSEQVTNPATRDRYIVSSLIEEAITSSQLEGAATSRQVAKAMIRSGRPPQDRSEHMILNNYHAMKRITELQNESLTPDLICEIHRIVTENALDDPENAGRIQTDDADRIAVFADGDQLLHRPPPVAELPARMARLCEFANGTDSDHYMPPVLRAMTVHFMMGYDHYFEDGNGRTARALFYWTMLRQGFWLTEFLTISRILKKAPAQYARSFLLTEQDDGDLTHFFLYHLTVVQRAIGDLHDYLATKAEELRDLQRMIKSMPGEFNYRQLALLENAAKNPGATFTAQSHALSHQTSGETARQDLMDLEGRGLLRRFKEGRRFVWAPVSDLAERLQSR